MSGQLELRRTQYLGIINGIVYRIESNLDGSEKHFELVPLEMQPIGLTDPVVKTFSIPPPPGPSDIKLPTRISSDTPNTVAHLPDVKKPVETAPVQKEEPPPVRLFLRDGAEPLRAGHPDLWHLLVAGTCLEGSPFKTATLSAETSRAADRVFFAEECLSTASPPLAQR